MKITRYITVYQKRELISLYTKMKHVYQVTIISSP